MQKNDFFAIVYRVLARLYFLMKDGRRLASRCFTHDDILFDINAGYWENIMQFLSTNDLVDGIECAIIPGVEGFQVKLKETVSITPRGIEYLQEDRMMQKAKKFYQNH